MEGGSWSQFSAVRGRAPQAAFGRATASQATSWHPDFGCQGPTARACDSNCAPGQPIAGEAARTVQRACTGCSMAAGVCQSSASRCVCVGSSPISAHSDGCEMAYLTSSPTQVTRHANATLGGVERRHTAHSLPHDIHDLSNGSEATLRSPPLPPTWSPDRLSQLHRRADRGEARSPGRSRSCLPWSPDASPPGCALA